MHAQECKIKKIKLAVVLKYLMCLVTEFRYKIISDHDAKAVSSHAKQSAN